MRYVFFLSFFFFAFSIHVNAQTTHAQESWWDYLNQNRYSDKWGSWLDVQLKLIDGYTHQKNAGEYTGGASYFANANLRYTAALTYVDGYPNAAHINHIKELRPWAMIQFTINQKHARWMQWLRVEERYKETALNKVPTGQFDMSTRVRYQIQAQFPLTSHKFEKGTFSFVTSEELYLNFGKNIVYNTFDQNRLFVGFFYYLNKSNILQLGYTNLYQKYNAPNRFLQSDVLRVSVFNNIDFRAR